MSQPDRETLSQHGTQAVHAPARPDGVDVLRILRARFPLFRNVVLAVVAAAIAVAFVLPPRYATTAVVMLEARKNNVTDQSAVLSEMPTDPASVQNQIQLLTSRDLAARVIDRLGLEFDPEFSAAPSPLNPLTWLQPAPPADPARHLDGVVTAFLKHLTVESVGLSTTITITFYSRDPVKSARIADAIADAYLDAQAAIRFDTAQRTTDWLIGRIRQLNQQVQAADAGIQRYKAEHNLNDTTNGGSLMDQQLAAINEQLVTARAALAAKEAESGRIVTLMKSGRVADVSQIVASPLIVQLREQQADLIRQQAQLGTKYGPQHPKMLAIESQKHDLDAKIDEEVERIVGSVDNDVAVARAQVHSLEESLQRAEAEAAGQNMARVNLQSLEAGAASTRSIYESFVSRLRETQGQDGLQTIDAREISHAPIPNAPSWPPKLLIVAASLPAGLLLGLLAVLLAEKFAGPVTEDLRKEPVAPRSTPNPVRVPLLADIAGISRAAEAAIDEPWSAQAQAFEAITRDLAARGPRVVAVTSLDPREGQTNVAAGLARTASRMGLKTVLVDGNLRAPATASRLGLAPGKAGIIELLSGKARLNDALKKDARSSAYVLAGPRHNVDPASVWSSPLARGLIDHLRRNAGLVVVDAVSLAPGNEFPRIAGLCDAVIVVAASTATPRPSLDAALAYLKSVTGAPTGLVLTR